MTKYILCGGMAEAASDGGRAFLEEMTTGFDEPVRILECIFSKEADRWQEAFVKDQQFFKKVLPDREFILELAEVSTFVEQLAKTDAVYFRGGRTKLLIKTLEECEGWQKELEGKTVAGSSAGMNFLSRYCYGPTSLEISKGLNILPIKTLPHYKSNYNAPNIDWDKAYQELEAYGEPLPIYAIGEGEFKVIEN